jgi:F-type H+-transporting ATPase subunit epsilon
MYKLLLKILTPYKKVKELEIISLNAPTVDGDVTILPKHVKFFSILKEGLVKYITKDKKEDFLAIGGGYIETDGNNLKLLVSRAYGQDEIDERLTEEAIDLAKKTIEESDDNLSIREAQATLRRSFIDLKLLKKVKKRG